MSEGKDEPEPEESDEQEPDEDFQPSDPVAGPISLFDGIGGLDLGLPLGGIEPSRFGLNLGDVVGLDTGWSKVGESLAATIGQTLNQSLFSTAGLNLFPILGDLWAPFFKPLQIQLSESFGLLTDLGLKFRGLWPENLDDVLGATDIETLKLLMLDEGLPIAWVPRAETMVAVVGADTAAKRRNIYGRRWLSIADDCAAREAEMDSVAMAPYKRFLVASIKMLRQGHYEGTQSLATSTIDSLTRDFLSRTTRGAWVGKDPIPDPEKLPIQNFFVACQLWGAYRPAYKNMPTPNTFSRHATAHRVTVARQYTRTNATIALAHLTSLMWAFDTAYRS